MTLNRLRFCVVLALAATLPGVGCGGKGSKPAPAKAAANSKADAKVETKAESTAPTAEASKDLGERFRDPPWFRKTMLEGAEVVSTSRSEADDQGRFKSHILFKLSDGTNVEQCADQVTEKVKTAVSNVERTTQDDGRISVSGSTERYKMTAICGEAKGVMRAYVGYEWTS